MNLLAKSFCLASTFIFSTSAFALSFMRHLDVLLNGGYSQAGTFSDTSADQSYGTMTGVNGGGMLLVSLSSRLINPVIGAGMNYMQLKSSVTDPTNTFKYNNTLTSQAGTGHVGLRVNGPLLRLFLLGNAGYGLSDKIVTDVVTVSDSTPMATSTLKMKNHVFYGGTAAFLVSAAPFIKLGVMGIYNMHSTTLQNQTDTTAADISTTYQEVSGNFVIDINL